MQIVHILVLTLTSDLNTSDSNTLSLLTLTQAPFVPSINLALIQGHLSLVAGFIESAPTSPDVTHNDVTPSTSPRGTRISSPGDMAPNCNMTLSESLWSVSPRRLGNSPRHLTGLSPKPSPRRPGEIPRVAASNIQDSLRLSSRAPAKAVKMTPILLGGAGYEEINEASAEVAAERARRRESRASRFC